MTRFLLPSTFVVPLPLSLSLDHYRYEYIVIGASAYYFFVSGIHCHRSFPYAEMVFLFSFAAS